MQRNGRAHRGDVKLTQRPPHGRDGLGARWPMHDQLADHRIVIGWDAIAGVGMRIDPNAWATRHAKFLDQSRRGREISHRIFGVDPALDRVAGLLDILLLHAQRIAGRDANLFLDQVNAGHTFGNRMLNLNPRIDFEDVKILVLIDEKFDCSCVGISRRLPQTHRRVAQRLSHILPQQWRGRLLDQLLMSALKGAITLPQMDQIPVIVAEDLHLHVPSPLDVFFDVNRRVFEGVLRLGLRLLDSRPQRNLIVSYAHSSSAAARRRFDDHRIADVVGYVQGVFLILHLAVAAGNSRHL